MAQLINTQLTTSTALTAGATIPLGSIVHRSGCTIKAGANTIKIDGAGFYRITANVTIEPSAVADMEISLLNNGTAIASATGTPAVAGDALNLTTQAVIYNKCACIEDLITLTVGSAGTVTECDVIVERM